MIGPFASSLSLRLLAIFAATALVLVALLAASFTQGLSSQWRRSIRPHLVQYVRYVQEDLGSPPDPARADRLAELVPVTIAIYRDDRFVHATDGEPLDLDALRFRPLPHRGPRHRHPPRPESPAIGSHRSAARADDAPPSPTSADGARLPSAKPPPVNAAVAHERSREGTVLRVERGRDTVYYRLEAPPGRRPYRADGLYLAVGAATLVLLGSYLLIRRQLAPIGEIQRGVGRMSGGELAHRIALEGHDDLAGLGRSIDDMAGRIDAMLEAKRELLLAMSHELRSPLARARVATELLPPSRQRERLEADLAEMGRLIGDLIESERLRSPHAALHRERLDLARLVAEELAPHALVPRVLDARDAPSGRRSALPPLPIVADAARLRVLVRNLVGNALRHGRAADGSSEVVVTLVRHAREARLEVADRGPGIAPEHLDAVTEPFHRPDAARSRGEGGVGLGLWLARLVAEAHGGTLRIESAPAVAPGTRVVVTLPLDADADAGPAEG